MQDPGRRLPVDGLGADQLDHELRHHDRGLPVLALGDLGVVLGPGGPGPGHHGDVGAHGQPAGELHHADAVVGELLPVHGDRGGAGRRRRRRGRGRGRGGGVGRGLEVGEVRLGRGEGVGGGVVEGGGRGIGPREEEEGREDREPRRGARGRCGGGGGEGPLGGAGGRERGRERRRRGLQLPPARVLEGERGGGGGGGGRRQKG